MIIYFTGTGNSRYIAEKIACITGDILVSMNDKIKQGDTQPINVSDRLVFVMPTYGWRIPRVAEQWIRETEFIGAGKVWFVMNCGSQIGNAAKYLRILCEEKKFEYMGTAEVIMPENYIAMFAVPEKEEAERIIAKADPVIEKIASQIKKEQAFLQPRNNVCYRLMSAAVNPIFYRVFIKADAFHADDRCIGCGKCETLCPLNNIQIKEGRPVWGKNCTHCMACICYCPTAAIEYGRKSIGKPRYRCER